MHEEIPPMPEVALPEESKPIVIQTPRVMYLFHVTNPVWPHNGKMLAKDLAETPATMGLQEGSVFVNFPVYAVMVVVPEKLTDEQVGEAAALIQIAFEKRGITVSGHPELVHIQYVTPGINATEE